MNAGGGGGGGAGRGHDSLDSASHEAAARAEGSTKAILATRQANARSRKLAWVSSSSQDEHAQLLVLASSLAFTDLQRHGISPQLHINPFWRAHFLQQ